MLEHVEREGAVTRRRILERFRHDDEAQAAAVLSDLVQSGLLMHEGRGDDAVYRPTSQRDRALFDARTQAEARSSLAWLHLYREPASAAELARVLGCSEVEAREAVAQLLADGVVEEEPAGVYRAPRLLIPVGSELGWEAAVFDHFRAMAAAIGAKVGRPRSLPRDRVGGATLSFDLSAEHPHRERVLALLEDTRRQLNALWDEVSAYNRAHPIPEEQRAKVYFYFGQYVEDEDKLSEDAAEAP
jgi:DNA-binding Lrp family transcriptional regulator